MVASCWVVLASALVGVGPVSGIVVDAAGSPSSGVEVLASGGGWTGGMPEVTGRAKTGQDGRFSLNLSVNPGGCDQPMLWAYRPGSTVAWHAIDRDVLAGSSVRLELGRASKGAITVVGPGGQAVSGARVVPTQTSRNGFVFPGALGELTASTTDLDGKAVLAAFDPEDLVAVRVEANGFGSQPREFDGQEGLAGVGPKSVVLRAAGRVEGHVVGSGLKVRMTSKVEGKVVGEAEVVTDGSGKFSVPAIAAGVLTVRVQAGASSIDLPVTVDKIELEAGRGVAVEVPVRRGVRVVGFVWEFPTKRPVEGAVVSLIPSSPGELTPAWTDADGRYEAIVPAGPTLARILRTPYPYLCPLDSPEQQQVEVPATAQMPPIELKRGSEVRGVVVDEAGEPVAGVQVEAAWTRFEGRNRTPMVVKSATRPDGTFTLGPVDPEAELSLGADSAESGKAGPMMRKPTEVEPIRLVLVDPEADRPTGRVVDAQGRPIAGATVRVVATDLDTNKEVKTDIGGRYRGLDRLQLDREYRVQGMATGHIAGQTPPLKPVRGRPTTFPDLVLAVEPVETTVIGRVTDTQARPIPGATVWASARASSKTDADGRFRLEDVSGENGFVFARADGYRFAGRVVGRESNLILTRLDETPAPEPRPDDHKADPATARRVIDLYLDKVLRQGDHATRARTLELVARFDPDRVLGIVERRGLIDDAWLADHLRFAAAQTLVDSNLDKARPVIDAIVAPHWRVMAELDAADSLPTDARTPWLDRADRDARKVAGPADKVEALARVADEWLDLKQGERARILIDEARPIAEKLPCATSGGRARCALIRTLARVDIPKALAMAAELIDPCDADRCRLEIAIVIAPNDPAEAGRIASTVRDPKAIHDALPELCHALAPGDPLRARALIAGSVGDDPSLPPYAIGMMALAVASTDKPAATGWLREAFDRLAEADAHPKTTRRDPAAVAAALIEVAEAVDPALVTELFWRALSLRSAHPDGSPRADAALVILLSHHDQDAAKTLLEPLISRLRVHSLPETDVPTVIEAVASVDANLAVKLLESLPEPPELTFHHPKNAARIALAAALARNGEERRDHATMRLLRLWTADDE